MTEDKNQKLLDMLNGMLECLKPLKWEDFNKIYEVKDQQQIVKFEKEYPDFVLRYKDYDDPKSALCTSSMAIMCSLTATLIGKKLVAQFNDEIGLIEKFLYAEETQ